MALRCLTTPAQVQWTLIIARVLKLFQDMADILEEEVQVVLGTRIPPRVRLGIVPVVRQTADLLTVDLQEEIKMEMLSATVFKSLITFALFIPIEVLVCIYVLLPAVDDSKFSTRRKVAFVVLSGLAFWLSYSINNPSYA